MEDRNSSRPMNYENSLTVRSPSGASLFYSLSTLSAYSLIKRACRLKKNPFISLFFFLLIARRAVTKILSRVFLPAPLFSPA
jgi:hypothetical protein